MLNVRTVGICAFGIVFATHGLDGQGLLQYRNFALGSDVASISILTGGTASEAKTIHKRPALLQERQPWSAGQRVRLQALALDPRIGLAVDGCGQTDRVQLL